MIKLTENERKTLDWVLLVAETKLNELQKQDPTNVELSKTQIGLESLKNKYFKFLAKL